MHNFKPSLMISRNVTEALENDAERIWLIDRMNSHELHEFLDQYNWDDGFGAVWAVINNPACELATALVAFWLAEPDLSSVPPAPSSNAERNRFVSELFVKISEGRFRTVTLAYDPSSFIVNRLQRVKLERVGLPSVFMQALAVPAG